MKKDECKEIEVAYLDRAPCQRSREFENVTKYDAITETIEITDHYLKFNVWDENSPAVIIPFSGVESIWISDSPIESAEPDEAH